MLLLYTTLHKKYHSPDVMFYNYIIVSTIYSLLLPYFLYFDVFDVVRVILDR
ncbi:MAG: hypothetical protein UY00_C0001G0016 [Candidatus Wolfebacteria bacterium GW2011_GWA1_47_6]|nr:MAG: hypothetical protein UY00_C0001G0016 [Candidatus Wolfebacteria bacterium GW2011_GWA1_47_6]